MKSEIKDSTGLNDSFDDMFNCRKVLRKKKILK